MSRQTEQQLFAAPGIDGRFTPSPWGCFFGQWQKGEAMKAHEVQRKSKKPVLRLPEGATLEIRKPRRSKLYMPVRVRFADGRTTPNWEDTLRLYGATIVDWENPRVVLENN